MAESDIKFAASEGGARAWQKVIKRNPKETLQTATDVGWLRPGDSRVNLLGSLDGPDKQNYYKVKVLSEGKFVMAARGDGELRFQLMDDHQRVVMDSKPNMGKASQNYEAMGKNELTLKAGTYYVKVTRADKVPDSQRINFAMQMVIGDGSYRHDYLTREVAPTKQDRINAVIAPESAKPASASVGFLGDFAGTSAGSLLNPPVIGKILSVLA